MLLCLSEGLPFTTTATLMSMTLVVTQWGRYSYVILKTPTAVVHNVGELAVNGTIPKW